MKTKIASPSNPFIRSVTVASLSVASLVLMGACQSYEEASEAMVTEELSTLETSDGVAEADITDVNTVSDGVAEADITDLDTAEEALLMGSVQAQCAVRCCNNRSYVIVVDSRNVCTNYARSVCGPGRIKRVRFAGSYIVSRVC